MAVALKVLYDEDVVDEAVIVAWYDKASAGSLLSVSPEAAKAVRAAAKPFAEWLKEDEDSEEDSDED